MQGEKTTLGITSRVASLRCRDWTCECKGI